MDQGTTQSARQEPASANLAVHDPYLDALEYLAGHHRLPFSRADITNNLPLEDGHLNTALFCRAAKRIGLNTKVVARKPSSVSPIACPYVVPLATGEVAIATRKLARRKTRIVVPGTPVSEDLAPRELDLKGIDYVIYVAPDDLEAEGGLSLSRRRPRGHWLWSVVARFWATWIYIIIAALFINLLGLALPLYVMNVYDRVVPNNSISTLWALAIGVGIALIFDFVLRMLRSIVIDSSGRRIDMRVSATLFEQALDASMAARPASAGEIASHIREFETVRDFFTSSGIMSLIDLMFIGVFLFVLWLLVGPLVLIPAGAVPLVLLATIFIQIPLGRAVSQTQQKITNRQVLLVESLVGIETVKAASAEGSLQRRWESAVASSVRSSSAIRFWSSLAMFLSLTVQQSVSVFILIWGVHLIADGEITVGALVASNILAGRVLSPLSGIAMTLSRAQQALSSLRQLNRMMKLEADHANPEHDAGSLDSGRIEFRELEFAYPGQGKNAIDGMSLSIAAGERIAIVGRVGSGKSTLGKLLCGLYRPDSGAILFDGADSRRYKLAELRSSVIYAGQDAVLFSGTVGDNITLGRPVSQNEFETCARVAGVTSFVLAHPQGYAMQVGERGKSLSGGQRQAVTLARAMAARPKILFLDEPTGAMDNLSEANFARGFQQWLPADTTLVVATHRTSLLNLVSRVIVMDNGKVVADGPRNKILEMLRKGNLVAGGGTEAQDG